MHILGQLLHLLTAPFLYASTRLSVAIAYFHGRPPTEDDFTVAAFLVTGAVACLASSYWAAWMYARLGECWKNFESQRKKLEASLRFYDLLLKGSEKSIAILEPGQDTPFFYGDGSTLFKECMASSNAGAVAKSLDRLLNGGIAFETTVRTSAKRYLSLRGEPLGRCAVVFFEQSKDDPALNFSEALDSVPIPVWLKASDGSLSWANRSFLEAAGAPSIDDRRATDGPLLTAEQELVSSALENATPIDTRRYVVVGGARRALQLGLSPLSSGGIVGSARDVTDAALSSARLELAADAMREVMDKLPIGIAAFNAEQRLEQFNSAYAELLGLPRSFLDTRPTQAEMLDKQRELRLLPEQRDFNAWKQNQLETLWNGKHPAEDHWHLHGGRSIHIRTFPARESHVLAIVEDVSERFTLKSESALFRQVQQATLEAVDDGMAVFATDGHLVLHNARFAQIWAFSEADLADHPHFQDLARISGGRFGQDQIWSMVSAAISAVEPERCSDWAKVRRADGHELSLSMSRLPNGDTAVAFSDLTELDEFRRELSNQAEGGSHATTRCLSGHPSRLWLAQG